MSPFKQDLNDIDFETISFIGMYNDGEYDDPNLSLPNYFITCLNEDQVELHQKAIEIYAARTKQDPCLEIDLSGQWNASRSPALLCFKRGEITAFWEIVDELKNL